MVLPSLSTRMKSHFCRSGIEKYQERILECFHILGFVVVKPWQWNVTYQHGGLLGARH